MTLPIELIVAFLTLTGTSVVSLVSIAVHLLIRINGTVNSIQTSHKLSEQETELKIASLERHTRRNEEEMKGLRRFLNLSPSPQQQHSS